MGRGGGGERRYVQVCVRIVVAMHLNPHFGCVTQVLLLCFTVGTASTRGEQAWEVQHMLKLASMRMPMLSGSR